MAIRKKTLAKRLLIEIPETGREMTFLVEPNRYVMVDPETGEHLLSITPADGGGVSFEELRPLKDGRADFQRCVLACSTGCRAQQGAAALGCAADCLAMCGTIVVGPN